MAGYIFQKAARDDLPRVFALIDGRIRWMDEVGIRQWNVTDYWGCYPPAHYERAAELGCLYVLRDARGDIIGCAVLWEQDARWPGRTEPAFYVHHLATDLAARGAGRIILEESLRHARACGKEYLRLDCAVDNPRLNEYYHAQGFLPAGRCVDGVYEGVLREKRV